MSERALLGAALLSPDAAETALSIVTDDDFSMGRYREVFRAIRELHAEGVTVDAVTVANKLGASLERMGGRAFLVELSQECMSTASAEAYATAVAEDGARRRFKLIAAEVMAACNDGADVEEIISVASGIERRAGGESKTVSRIVADNIDSYAQPREYYRLSDWGVRLRAGSVTIVGARPAVGKSAFALQEAQALAERHVRCRIYSYEMSEEEWTDRLVAHNACITSSQIDDGLTDGMIASIRQVFSEKWPQFIDVADAIGWPVSKVVSDMRRFAREGGKVVFIDYLQLMVKQSYEDVTEVSRQLKIAARVSGLAVVPLSQLSRKVAQGDGKLRPPSLTDLRQSGALEQDADNVVLLHTYDADDNEIRSNLRSRGYLVDDPMNSNDVLGHVFVAKNRRGPANVLMPAFFDGRGQSWDRINQEVKS